MKMAAARQTRVVAVDAVSADGSPVAVYLAQPAGDGPMLIHDAVGAGGSILELGCGPGRITRFLIALGHEVTAVDDSPAMLEHVTGARTVCADLYTLELDHRFDAVVAGSHLVNDPGRRAALLSVCRRHVHDGGTVLVERFAPGRLRTAERTVGQSGPVEIEYEPLGRNGRVVSARTTYRLAGRRWVQDWEAEDVDDSTMRQDATAAGLQFVDTLDADGRWVRLRATDSS
jgi:SAM-dependent methyltransferase